MLQQQSFAPPNAISSRLPKPAHPFWRRLVPWGFQIAVAAILAQTLFFKFTYAPETQVIFSGRGGRPAATLVGLIELICAILLLVPVPLYHSWSSAALFSRTLLPWEFKLSTLRPAKVMAAFCSDLR